MANLVDNNIIRRDFEILDTWDAGIELLGFEVKSLKSGKGSLRGAFVKLIGDRPVLMNAYIPEYQANNTSPAYDPYRTRNLLLNKKEINQLLRDTKEKGLTIVPIDLYNKGRLVKLKIGLAKGLKKHDKREKIKERDTKRDIQRTLKTR
ncbi:MAG TPA: SsrA-binding protein SmpB [Candidatus Paceibacterota bacterium]|nr:SsrA-binding protein SmpB [Candidatus Paceibacterota bacterium]